MSAIQKYKRRAKELEEENAKLKAQLAERNNPKELDLAISEQLSKLEAELGSEVTRHYIQQGDGVVRAIRHLMKDFGGYPQAGLHIAAALMQAHSKGASDYR